MGVCVSGGLWAPLYSQPEVWEQCLSCPSPSAFSPADLTVVTLLCPWPILPLGPPVLWSLGETPDLQGHCEAPQPEVRKLIFIL